VALPVSGWNLLEHTDNTYIKQFEGDVVWQAMPHTLADLVLAKCRIVCECVLHVPPDLK